MITLYSTGCPKCVILEKKMNQKHLEYETVSDVDLMQEKGFTSLPMLDVDGNIYDFKEALSIVDNMEE